MENDDELQKRVVELEIKASLADDLLDQLNQTVFRQQRQIEFLMREIAELKQSGTDGGTGLSSNLRDELPPHY